MVRNTGTSLRQDFALKLTDTLRTFFLSLKESDHGCVYLYAQDGDALFEIADSFDDFIRALYRL